MNQAPPDTELQLAQLLDSIPLEVRSAIPAIKRQHRDIFHVCLADNHYIFRPLNKGEFKECLHYESYAPELSADWVADQAVVYPHSFSTQHTTMNIVDALGRIIYAQSGFGNVGDMKAVVDLTRQVANAIDIQINLFLWKAFKLPDSTIEDMNIFQVAEKLALAEIMLGNKFEIFSPEDMENMKTKHKYPMMPKGKGSTDDRYIAPGGSPDEIKDIAKKQRAVQIAEEFMQARGIKGPGPKRLSHLPSGQDFAKAVATGDATALRVDSDMDAALAYLQSKQLAGGQTNAQLNYGQYGADATQMNKALESAGVLDEE